MSGASSEPARPLVNPAMRQRAQKSSSRATSRCPRRRPRALVARIEHRALEPEPSQIRKNGEVRLFVRKQYADERDLARRKLQGITETLERHAIDRQLEIVDAYRAQRSGSHQDRFLEVGRIAQRCACLASARNFFIVLLAVSSGIAPSGPRRGSFRSITSAPSRNTVSASAELTTLASMRVITSAPEQQGRTPCRREHA